MSDTIKGFIQLICVFIFIGGSWVISGILQSQKTTPQQTQSGERSLFVETKDVAPGPYRIVFETTGTIETRSNINIVPQVAGRIIQINKNFFEGGAFEADEILFEIDPRDFELEVERLDAQVASARTAFNIEEAESKAALLEWKQLNGKKEPPLLVARKPQMEEAWANLKAAKAQLENAKLDLERTKFSFPFAGRVLRSNLENGQYVTAGQSYGDVFNLKGLEVDVSLEDKQLEWLLKSDRPDIQIKANYLGQTKTYDGYLKRSAASLDPLTRFARVSIGFKDQLHELLPGVFVSITIKGSALNNITVVPASALQKDGRIWILNDDKTLRSLVPDVIYASKDTIALANIQKKIAVVTSRVSGATEGTKALISKPAQNESDLDG